LNRCLKEYPILIGGVNSPPEVDPETETTKIIPGDPNRIRDVPTNLLPKKNLDNPAKICPRMEIV